MVGFCFELSELDILCVYNGEKRSDWKHLQFMLFHACFYNVFFIKVKKNMFLMFFLICKSMFLTSMIADQRS